MNRRRIRLVCHLGSPNERTFRMSSLGSGCRWRSACLWLALRDLQRCKLRKRKVTNRRAQSLRVLDRH
ncbi:uncharacterized protein PHALS_15091 [Plasmopara halstedii]|uniref:Uncharacterized protein n=1 Tax=Plasmopara halstedii TaxID=4781 RepID=A0A0P1AB57_PLAHL|nr:uncharacterized protein PHALS_15091 [Plasmopara halstedii]CEG37626.1 hypothetical protein PHALS_15091 [Plasmopara halstedii]|eukprot:XP_024573995.1 hypothetical protein PHALS_15091 [Plasmopara halstedii]